MCSIVLPDDLFIDIGDGDLELGKRRIESLITGIHLEDCDECHGDPAVSNIKLSPEFILDVWTAREEARGNGA